MLDYHKFLMLVIALVRLFIWPDLEIKTTLLSVISIKAKDEEERSHTPGQMALEGM